MKKKTMQFESPKEKKQKKKKIVYGIYDEARNEPQYIKENNYKLGLSDQEVQERIDKLQVNIEGKIESTGKKNFKMILNVITKNTFTFFNILYIIVLVLLLIANYWNSQPGMSELSKQQFAITDYVFLAIVLFNLIVGIIQESRSKLAINRLKLVTTPKVTLIRNGEKVQKDNTDIVLDDIIYLTPGIQIVSDAILLDEEMEVNESQLTGESVPIKKKKGDMIYSGSFVVSGTAYAKVAHVGKLNEINKLTSQAKKYVAPKSQILLGLRRLLLIIGFFIVVTSVAMFAWSWNWAGFREIMTNWTKELDIGLKVNYIQTIKPITAAIIGMIPAGLYLLTSVALSVGVFRLSKNNTLVQDIYCIEMLARVNVLCLDKTGTITNGQMTVVNYDLINKAGQHSVEDIISSMNAALQETNATAKALENYFGVKAVLKPTEVIPFSSERKYSAVSFGNETYITGAPDFVIKDDFEKYADKITDYANKGLRVLCLAHTNTPLKDGKIQKAPRLIALILIEDQIREEASDTIRYFKENGVEVKVISGDNPITVSKIAKQVGIKEYNNYIDMSTLKSDKEVKEAALKYTIFGRVSPTQKKALVLALQEKEKTVAMTGDGVNDVLALKASDCSIAMANGSDATKSVAQLILLDSNFASMPKVVAEGRRTINNIQRSASLFLVKTIYSTILALMFLFMGSAYPFVPIQLSLISTVTIGIPSFILALEPNKERIKGEFLKNVVARALPTGLTVALNIFVISILYKNGIIPTEQYSSLCVIATGICGIILLFTLAKSRKSEETMFPVSIFRLSLAIILTGMFVFGLTVLNWWFNIAPIEPMIEKIARIIVVSIINFIVLTILFRKYLKIEK